MSVNSSEQSLTIDEIRQQIDDLDSDLLSMFNRRALLALQIGRIKKTRGLPVYDPSREKKIFDRMRADNPGPLDNQAIVRLFERVIDESRRLERIMTAEGAE
jgi:chorismate mutase